MDCSPPGLSVHGILRQEYWSGLPCPPAGGSSSLPSSRQTTVLVVSESDMIEWANGDCDGVALWWDKWPYKKRHQRGFLSLSLFFFLSLPLPVPLLLFMCRPGQDGGSCLQAKRKRPQMETYLSGTLILDFLASRSEKIKFCCLCNLVCGILLLVTWADGEGNGNPLQYSCLENPRDRRAWWAAVCGVT